MTRRESRETAFVLLFERTFTDEPISDIIEKAKDARDAEVDEFASGLAGGAASQLEKLDAEIEPALHNWSKERISRVALTVLRLAVYELRSAEDTPVSIVINEAVEIAKKFGGDEDPSFVNGVLGTLVRK